MKTNPTSTSALFNARALLGFALCSSGVFLAMASFAANPNSDSQQPGASQLVARPNAPVATAAAQWSIVTSPNIGSSDVLRDVACVSASNCWAVGSYRDGSVYQTLIEHWDGIGWSIVTSPNTDPTLNNYLNAVTCTSATECWAVGSDSNQTLIEHWDGTSSSWQIVTSPSPSLAVLNDVTCTDANNCWAVGDKFLFSTSAGGVASVTAETLIKHWHDGVWTNEPAPAPGIVVTGVACVDATNCWAVGNYMRSEIIPGFIPEIQSSGGGPGPIPPCGLICFFCIGPECGPLRSIYGAIQDTINNLSANTCTRPAILYYIICGRNVCTLGWDFLVVVSARGSTTGVTASWRDMRVGIGMLGCRYP